MSRNPLRFVQTAETQVGNGLVRDYNVEVHLDGAVRTIGRVYGADGDWIALGIGMDGWTSHYRTRAEATNAMIERRTFTEDRRREVEARVGHGLNWG